MVDLSATPDYQSLDQIKAATGLGAFVIGGDSAGGGTNWGQNINEDFVTGLFQLPTLTGSNMLDVLAKALNMLPTEALQQWQQLFPSLADVNWSDPTSIINAILSQVIPKPIMQSVVDFENWVTNTFNATNTLINQVVGILSGQSVTPFNDLIVDVQNWWVAIGGKTSGLNTSGQLDVNFLLGLLGMGQVSGLPDLNTMVNQITQIFNDEVVTPINAAVQKVKDAWNSITADVSDAITTGDWNPLLTALFGGTSVGSTIQLPAIPPEVATPVTSWLPRLFTDLTILFDLLHGTYPAGSPSDTKTTTSGGKRTWWSAVADILDLFHLSQTTTALAIGGQTVGQALSAAQTTASTAQDAATGASIDAGSALSQLTALPAQNVVPTDSVSGQPVALVASGLGATGTGVGSLSITWTDTIPSTANYVIVAVNTATTHNSNVWVRVNGQGMSQLTRVPYASSGSVTLFGLANPPVGAVTFLAQAVDGSSLFSIMAGTSMAFSNVATVSTPATNGALGGGVALNTLFNSSQFVVNAIGTFGTSGSNVGLSAYNRTQRYHPGNFNGGSQFNMDLIAGTVSGVTNPNFTATVASTTNEGFAAAAVALNAPPTIMGSYARAFRSSTSGFSTSTAAHRAGNFGSVFDTYTASDDIAVDLSTGRMTVSYSGTYLFKVGIAFTGIFTTQTMEGSCIVNGQLFERTNQQWYASSNQTGFTWSTPVFLNAGQYVEPGCQFGSGTLISVVGDSVGSKTYMTLSLLNRSLL